MRNPKLANITLLFIKMSVTKEHIKITDVLQYDVVHPSHQPHQMEKAMRMALDDDNDSFFGDNASGVSAPAIPIVSHVHLGVPKRGYNFIVNILSAKF